MNDLDKYYTPLDVATNIIKKADFTSPKICVDPTCGSGNLLSAADKLFENINCFGIDKDRSTINSLRKKKPLWNLSVADFLRENSYKKTKASANLKECDLVLLNPPFSHFKTKYVDINYSGQNLKGSIAMAYLLRSLELFSPREGALVVAPESLLYSQTDEHARHLIEQNYKFEHIQDLESKTFYGARVHSSTFRLTSKSFEYNPVKTISNNLSLIKCNFVRGALPVYKSKQKINLLESVQFIHSTDLKFIQANRPHNKNYTSVTASGRISGDVILIPRVGVPNVSNTKIYRFNETVQLSDCLIAIQCVGGIEYLKEIEKRLITNWNDFSLIYRGTGARYITIARLQEFLLTLNIKI